MTTKEPATPKSPSGGDDKANQYGNDDHGVFTTALFFPEIQPVVTPEKRVGSARLGASTHTSPPPRQNDPNRTKQNTRSFLSHPRVAQVYRPKLPELHAGSRCRTPPTSPDPNSGSVSAVHSDRWTVHRLHLPVRQPNAPQPPPWLSHISERYGPRGWHRNLRRVPTLPSKAPTAARTLPRTFTPPRGLRPLGIRSLFGGTP